MSKICSCCEDSLPSAKFRPLAAGTACTHENSVCEDCWQQWLDVQLSQNSTSAISCVDCDNQLHQNDIQAVGSQEILTRYLHNSIRELLAADPNFRWCAAENCTSGQVHHTGADGNIFTCVACGHKSCVDCIADWHAGQTCEAFSAERAAQQAARKAEEAALEQWEYLKEVNRRRRRGSISDAAATLLMEQGTPSALSSDAVEEAENTATITRSAKQCPGCTTWIEKIEYATNHEIR